VDCRWTEILMQLRTFSDWGYSLWRKP